MNKAQSMQSMGAVLPGSSQRSLRGDSSNDESSQEVEAMLARALRWSRDDASRWRAAAFNNLLSGLKPLPKMSMAGGQLERTAGGVGGVGIGGGDTNGGVTLPKATADAASAASESLTELVDLAKKLSIARATPKVVMVKGAKMTAGTSAGTGSGGQGRSAVRRRVKSAREEWQSQQAALARLRSEWREAHKRAGSVIARLEGDCSVLPKDSKGFVDEGVAEAKFVPGASRNLHGLPGLRVARLSMPVGCVGRPLPRSSDALNATGGAVSSTQAPPAPSCQGQAMTQLEVGQTMAKPFGGGKQQGDVIPVVMGRDSLARLHQALLVV
ncbi:unnamed protein product [Choristocarpus tenellus]